MDQEENNAINELMNMSYDQLSRVSHERKKWRCQAKNCENGTKVWDFGLGNFYFSERKGWGWVNVSLHYFLCGKHAKWAQKLLKRFDVKHIEEKLLDFKKDMIVNLPPDKPKKKKFREPLENAWWND